MALPFSEPGAELHQETRCSQPSDQRAHIQEHYVPSAIVRNIILGFADGLTVPFALTAGLSSLGSSKLVVVGGLAELLSGSISMASGAYLAAVTERDHYIAEERREKDKVADKPQDKKMEICHILGRYGIRRDTSDQVIQDLERNLESWARFILDFELRLDKPRVSLAWTSAASMGLAYLIGGLIPMIPYFAESNVTHALFISIGITIVILLAFGYIKTWVVMPTKRASIYGAFQTLFIGALAAGASYGIVRAIDSAKI